MNWPMLILLALAASRATHLVADDVFPFGALREWLGDSEHPGRAPYIGHGLGCTFCVSVWAGAASAGLAVGMAWATLPSGFWPALAAFAVLWFSFAFVVVLLESVVERLNS